MPSLDTAAIVLAGIALFAAFVSSRRSLCPPQVRGARNLPSPCSYRSPRAQQQIGSLRLLLGGVLAQARRFGQVAPRCPGSQ